MAADSCIIAGTTLARGGYGVLLRGKSGSGKSDLALRALSTPLQLPREAVPRSFELVSDDQTVLTLGGGGIIASPPAAIAGKLEVRGLGIVSWSTVNDVRLALVVDLTTDPIERMPDFPGDTVTLLGFKLGLVRLNPFEASAPAKLALLLVRASGGVPPC